MEALILLASVIAILGAYACIREWQDNKKENKRRQQENERSKSNYNRH